MQANFWATDVRTHYLLQCRPFARVTFNDFGWVGSTSFIFARSSIHFGCHLELYCLLSVSLRFPFVQSSNCNGVCQQSSMCALTLPMSTLLAHSRTRVPRFSQLNPRHSACIFVVTDDFPSCICRSIMRPLTLPMTTLLTHTLTQVPGFSQLNHRQSASMIGETAVYPMCT